MYVSGLFPGVVPHLLVCASFDAEPKVCKNMLQSKGQNLLSPGSSGSPWSTAGSSVLPCVLLYHFSFFFFVVLISSSTVKGSESEYFSFSRRADARWQHLKPNL